MLGTIIRNSNKPKNLIWVAVSLLVSAHCVVGRVLQGGLIVEQAINNNIRESLNASRHFSGKD